MNPRKSTRASPRSLTAVVVALALAAVPMCLADVFIWTGLAGGGDKKWETAANWKLLSTGAAPAAAPLTNPNDHVTIPADSGLIKITNDAKIKMIKSLDMEPSTVLPGTILETDVEAGTGRGKNLLITTTGTLPGDAAVGIRIGECNMVWATDSIPALGVPSQPGGNVVLTTLTGRIVADNQPASIALVIMAGRGANGPVPVAGIGGAPAAGGNVTILAKDDVLLTNSRVRGGGGGDSTADTKNGAPGGKVIITSADGAISIDGELFAADYVRAGDGGNGFVPMLGASGSQGGDGGMTKLVAKTDVLISFTSPGSTAITGGKGGGGSGAIGALVNKAKGGPVEIDAGGQAKNSIGIVAGGDGFGSGGSVTINADTVENKFASIIKGGTSTGTETKGKGGDVTIKAKTLIEQRGPFLPLRFGPGTIQGGRGAPGNAATPPGPGGKVTLGSDNPPQVDDIINRGIIRGGNVGPLVPAPANPIAGANVTLTAKKTVLLGDTSEIEGGQGSDPPKPRGNVTIKGGKIVGCPNQLLTGKRIHGIVQLARTPGGVDLRCGVLDSTAPPADIDFSSSVSGAITADELVCLNAGPDGDINLSCAAPDSIVAGDPERGIRGQIHILAGDIQIDSCTKDPLTLEQITEPDATVDTILCECCQIGCPADLDEDGDVDGIDLAMLLAAWGKCATSGGAPCPADLNADGFVDSNDLAVLLSAWGPCDQFVLEGVPPDEK